jgi:hypothetical protein
MSNFEFSATINYLQLGSQLFVLGLPEYRIKRFNASANKRLADLVILRGFHHKLLVDTSYVLRVSDFR